MNLVVPLALFILAWLFSEQGLQFFAFLAFVAAGLMVLLPLLQGKQPSSGVKSYGDGIVVDTSAPEIPELITVQVKRDWKNNDMFEDNLSQLGEAADTIGRTAKRFLFGKKKKKEAS
ncbi:MAG: hypothetical protein WC607_01025 [Candidatus Micrarchaeia archaeon]